MSPLLEDGEFEIKDGKLHVWDWRTTDSERTRKWQKEGEVFPLNVSEEALMKAYARGEIKTVSQLLTFAERGTTRVTPYDDVVVEGKPVTGRILAWEGEWSVEIQLIEGWDGYYYVQKIIRGDITTYKSKRFKTLDEARKEFERLKILR